MSDATKRIQWFAVRSRTPGPTRAVVDSALSGTNLTGSRGIVAELARSAADLVDSARRQQDARLWLSASTRLLGLIERLGLVAAVDDGGDVDGADGGDGLPGGLADALGAGATLGNSEDTE